MATYTSGQVLTASSLGAGFKDVMRIVAYGSRSTDSPTTTTELGILRIDGIPVIGGHRYYTMTTFLVYCGTATNDFIGARLRYSTTGTATTSSTTYGPNSSITNNTFTALSVYVAGSFVPAASGTVSILLSVLKAAGAGAVGSRGLVELPLWDCGPDATGLTVTVL